MVCIHIHNDSPNTQTHNISINVRQRDIFCPKRAENLSPEDEAYTILCKYLRSLFKTAILHRLI